MLPVQNLFRFPPRDFDLTGIRHDHIVPAVHYPTVTFPDSQAKKKEKHTTRVVNWLVLSHKHDRYSLRQLSEDTVFRVGMMPYACIGEGSLIRLSEPI